jgi:hypothetical protein
MPTIELDTKFSQASIFRISPSADATKCNPCQIFRGHVSYDVAKHFDDFRMANLHNRCFLCFFETRFPFILRRTNAAGYYRLLRSMLILSNEFDCPGVLGIDEQFEDWLR